jgi:UDP-N-acetylmuramoyl-tripeptide--D-alanyl-D-alanine ligase
MFIGNYALYGFFITVMWLGTAIFDLLTYTYLWQLKEYRLDRMKDFLKSVQGQNYIKDYRFIWRVFAALVLFIRPVSFVALFVLIADIIYLTVKKPFPFRRPKLTFKTMLILAASFLFEISLFQFFPLNLPLLLALRVVIVSGIVLLIGLPSFLIKKYYIIQATSKLKTYSKLTVIGITGSYGKSSVKEFAAHLLSTQFRVVKTPHNTNSEIGVAKFILQTDFSEIDIFVCEMGAYKIGEIATLAQMVKPKVGILTTIGEQHLSLFGSIENIQTAKYELLRSLPADGLAITHADNPLCTEKLKELTCQNIETCGYDEKNKPTYLILHQKSTLKGSFFEAIYQGQRGEISIPHIGSHQAYNASLAIMLAVNFGVDSKKLIEATKTLPLDVQGSLQKYEYGAATIIDDSYNSNPAGFLSALDVLALFPKTKKRIVITRGMLELGEKSNEAHEKIGAEIAKTCNSLVIITPDFVEPLKLGAGADFAPHIQTLFQAKEILQFIQDHKDIDCVILLENRIPEIVKQELKK